MIRPSLRQILSAAAAVMAFTGTSSLIPAQRTPMPAAFDVASIRLHDGPLHRMMDLTISGTLIRMEGYNIFMLIMEAYHVKGFQISLASVRHQEPEIRETMYDIVARAPGHHAPTRDEVRLMLQNLLLDRFGLIAHRERKEMGAYALVVGKKGPALKISENDSPCSVHVSVDSDGETSRKRSRTARWTHSWIKF